MGSDLFSSSSQLERLPLPDAEVFYVQDFELGRPASSILHELINQTPWRAENVTVWGKTHAQPRLIAWYGDKGRTYTYSRIRLEPLPWTPALLEIKSRVEAASGATFNSVLLNYYRDHRDSMGLHSDDEPELGPEPTIASISLGEQRVFILKHKYLKDLKSVKIPLSSGSLLLMKGKTQSNWKHGIDKESRPCGARVNLTFRKINN